MNSRDRRAEATPAEILIVDDRPANLLALEAVLEPLQRRVVSARSGNEALLKVLETDFAVILMDVSMPDLDGMETASLIRDRERSRNVPIIFVTAESTDLDKVRHAYALGGVDYIIKPFDPLIMRSKVNAFVQLHEQADSLRRHALNLAGESGRALLAEHAVHSKDMAISILGHDLRSPLAVMETGVTMLKVNAREADRVLLGRMERSIRRMDGLIGNVLDFARASLGGGMRAICCPGDLKETVSEVVEELRHSHAQREIQLEIIGSTAISFDATRMGQVVSNLVGNALQHSTEDPIHVLLDGSEGARVRLVVTNSGAIAPAVVPRLFEPFRRPDDSTNGLGLGLYIVREIARAHGGTVEVKVERERPVTSFVFSMPREPKTPPGIETSAS